LADENSVFESSPSLIHEIVGFGSSLPPYHKVFKPESKIENGGQLMQDSKVTAIEKSRPKILVAGATGTLGTKITQILIGQKKPVRCLVRNRSNYQPLATAGVQTVIGDLKDRQSLEPACQEIDTVITTANSFLRSEPDNPQTVDLEGNRKLVDAAKAAGAKQFIFVSASAADPNSPVPFLQAKAKTEEYLRMSGLTHTILAPNAFMDFWVANAVGLPAINGQPVSIVGEGRRKHSFVSAADVAKIAVASIDNPKASNQRLLIGGPEPISLLDTIAVYERLLGRKITVNHVAPMQPVPAFSEGSLAPFSRNLLPVFASFEMFDSPMDMTEITKRFNIKLTTIEEFAGKMIAGS
jgi:uncharacterized protein YbjT (DUF2867 family)